MFLRLFFFLSFSLLPFSTLLGQTNANSAYWNYINQYKELAIRQMNSYKIPASITLAQALLESGAGRSYLARVANNHFGIKVSGYWTGPYVLRSDDRPNEQFRKYENVEESYRDHSLFLTSSQRYSFLFNYSIHDYKAWAHGLKKAGYATNPRYAYSLIQVIETYNLHQLDHLNKLFKDNPTDPAFLSHTIGINNGLYYLITKPGDTFKSLATLYGVSARKLRKYNELPKGFSLQPNMIIYFERKHKKASKEWKKQRYEVQANESLYDVSQKFGIRLASLYKLNALPEDYSPEIGEKLRVR